MLYFWALFSHILWGTYVLRAQRDISITPLSMPSALQADPRVRERTFAQTTPFLPSTYDNSSSTHYCPTSKICSEVYVCVCHHALPETAEKDMMLLFSSHYNWFGIPGSGRQEAS